MHIKMLRLNNIKRVPFAVFERVAAALKVLSHPHRLQIAERLMERDLTVGELGDALDIPQAACSRHLSLMRAHGLLEARRRGRTVHYNFVARSTINVIRCIHKHETVE